MTVITNAEQFYQRIANAIATSITDEWSVVEYEAMFYSDGSTYEAEYIRSIDGIVKGFQPKSDGARAVRELRKAFREAGQQVWGHIRFTLRVDGSFDTNFQYDGCNSNGDLPFDEDSELQRHGERRLRLISASPKQA